MKKSISIFILIGATALTGVSMLLWDWKIEILAMILYLFGVYLLCKADSEENSDGA